MTVVADDGCRLWSRVTPGAAHYPWLENPVEFRRQALAFLTAE
jgi:pimeloyl-ACP methyl ester carboxylesterase